MKGYKREESNKFIVYFGKPIAYSFRYIKYTLNNVFYSVAENLPAATILSGVVIGGCALIKKTRYADSAPFSWVPNVNIFNPNYVTMGVITAFNTVLVGYVRDLHNKLTADVQVSDAQITPTAGTSDYKVHDFPNLYAPVMTTFISQSIAISLELLRTLIALGVNHSEKRMFDAKHDIDYLLSSATELMKDQEYFSAFRNYRSARIQYQRLYEMQLSRYAVKAKLFDIYLYEAKALFLIKKYDHPKEIHALQVLDKLLLMDNQNKDALNLRGMIYLVTSKRQFAKRDFEDSLDLDSTQGDIFILKSYCSEQLFDILKFSDPNYNALWANGVAHLVLFFQGKANFKKYMEENNEQKIKYLTKAFEYFWAAKKTVPQNEAYIGEQLAIYRALFITILELINYLLIQSKDETHQLVFTQLVPDIELNTLLMNMQQNTAEKSNSVKFTTAELFDEMRALQIKIERIFPLHEIKEKFLNDNNMTLEKINENNLVQFLKGTFLAHLEKMFNDKAFSIEKIANEIYRELLPLQFSSVVNKTISHDITSAYQNVSRSEGTCDVAFFATKITEHIFSKSLESWGLVENKRNELANRVINIIAMRILEINVDEIVDDCAEKMERHGESINYTRYSLG